MTTDPGRPSGYYPQDAYYAPGWRAPADQPPPPRNRRPLVITLVVIGTVVVLAVIAGLVLGLRYWLDVRPLGEVEAARSATPRQLDVGHCLAALPPDGDVSRVEVLPCDEPHQAEVVGALDLPGQDWPGQDVVEQRAEAYCEMDTAQGEAGFRPVAWSPTQTGWGQGDRRALCLASLDEGTATGSFTAGDDVQPS